MKRKILYAVSLIFIILAGLFWNHKNSLPRVYDSRKEGRILTVRNQGDLGTCWAFASLTALENSLRPKENPDFSEDHMSLQNSFGLSQTDGGDYTMSMAYLLAWQGPVWEADDPYGDGISPAGISPVKHVQEIQVLPQKDYGAIKDMVMKYGGVQSSLYISLTDYQSSSDYYNAETKSYYYKGSQEPSHEVVIIGWDDTYPRENFSTRPKQDGAFLCASSWGEDFGMQGFFYVSYEDSNMGVHNVVYTRAEDPDYFDHIYQTDLCGWIGQMGYEQETAYGANVYRTDTAQTLAAAGFYATLPHTRYEIYVTEGIPADLSQQKKAAWGTLDYAGYYTIEFKKPVELEAGQQFAVIIKLTSPGAIHPMAIEYQVTGINVDISDGEGYISLDGITWESTEKAYNCNLCLKAYTIDMD